ncbi:MAG: MmgE/PrpD family protein [Candidatus Caldarchaeum sp.]
MFDRVVQQIVEFSLREIRLRDDVLNEVKRRVLDSFGCFLGAWNEEALTSARKAALKYAVRNQGSTLWVTGEKTTPEWASFANAVGVRALDFNDTYLSKEPLHPSDMIAAILAAAETSGADGRAVAEAIAVGYEVGCRLCDAVTLRKKGWDHVNFTMVAAAAGVGRVMGLDAEKLGNALSLAVVPHAAMRQTRAGELSMWKGAAAANACRNAVFACMLAENGMTGPSQPFEGEMGFFKQVSGEAFSLETLPKVREPDMILKTYIKYHPVEYHAMTAVDAALKVLEKAGSAQNISKVRVATFEASYTILAKDREKWRPRTRETADHSLPYIVAVTLLDGGVWLDSFSADRVKKDDVASFIDRIEVVEDTSLTARYPEELPNKITAWLKDGRQVSEEVAIPRGHYKNPMTNQEVEAKFNRLASGLLSEEQRKEVVNIVWDLEKLGSVSELVEVFVK